MTSTVAHLAEPVDFDAHGDYAPPPGAYAVPGDMSTLAYPIADRISDDGSTGFRAEPGRYHLYVSLYCPWAQRPVIALKLRGLERVVTWSTVDPVRDGRGWAFREGRGYGPDPVNGFTFLRQAYDATIPDFDGHVSVPALWDRVTGRLVSNHYATMTVDLETAFADHATPGVALYPPELRREIDDWNAVVVGELATAGYQAFGATTQEAYDAVSDRVFAALERLDRHLATRRYLVGDSITDADLMLFVHLQRFDLVAGPLGRLTARRLVDHEHLWAYARDLYQRPEFRTASDLDHIMQGTYRTGAGIRTGRVVPAAPRTDWDAPAGRDRLR